MFTFTHVALLARPDLPEPRTKLLYLDASGGRGIGIDAKGWQFIGAKRIKPSAENLDPVVDKPMTAVTAL